MGTLPILFFSTAFFYMLFRFRFRLFLIIFQGYRSLCPVFIQQKEIPGSWRFFDVYSTFITFKWRFFDTSTCWNNVVLMARNDLKLGIILMARLQELFFRRINAISDSINRYFTFLRSNVPNFRRSDVFWRHILR